MSDGGITLVFRNKHAVEQRLEARDGTVALLTTHVRLSETSNRIYHLETVSTLNVNLFIAFGARCLLACACPG